MVQSAQKPRQVIEAMDAHGGILLQRASRQSQAESTSTQMFEDARESVARFINASTPDEVVITKGGTESINLVAATYGRKYLNEGDEILITVMEHHANIVPWQLLRVERASSLRLRRLTMMAIF